VGTQIAEVVSGDGQENGNRDRNIDLEPLIVALTVCGTKFVRIVIFSGREPT
jgi:hypothetical protein